MSCCKFGETVFQSVFDLYSSNPNENIIKAKTIEFFLFQMKIHNPNDVDNNHSTSYAFSWLSWKNSVYKIYNLLIHEIEKNEGVTVRNQVFFVLNNGVKKICDDFTLLYVKVCKQVNNYQYVAERSIYGDVQDTIGQINSILFFINLV